MNDDAKSLILRDDRIIETIGRLGRRISDRFPEAGLSALCGQLLDVAQKAAQRSAAIAEPILWIRVLSLVVTLLLVSLLIGSVVVGVQAFEGEQFGVLDLVQTLDAVLNEVILLSVAIVFFFTLETRLKRRRALAAVHELRSIAHIIDMHQLTKDPERFLRDWSDAEHSPKRNMTPQQLNRYLDYCSEMLSLTGKVAALYVQKFDDGDAVNAVSDLEQLTTGLSRKIWQKIMILQQLRESAERGAAVVAPIVPAKPAAASETDQDSNP